MANPTLVEVTRGPLVESFHTGAIALARPSGELVLGIGDLARPVFARSAIKSLQCLPLIESGAADRFNFGAAEIALACASHTGAARHAMIAESMVTSVGLGEHHLCCGLQTPMGEGAARALFSSGGRPTQFHNNCSGKHAGMLATAIHLDEPVSGYADAAHPVQRRISKLLSEMTGLGLGPDALGYDGCSVPTWAMPLRSMAALFAKLGTGEGLSASRRDAVQRIMRSCWQEPDLVAGPGRADTVVMAKLPGQVFMKTGAEGVYCGALPELGLGFALKVDDGATRASAGLALALIERLIPAAGNLMNQRTIKNRRGIDVGEIRTSTVLDRALDGIKI